MNATFVHSLSLSLTSNETFVPVSFITFYRYSQIWIVECSFDKVEIKYEFGERYFVHFCFEGYFEYVSELNYHNFKWIEWENWYCFFFKLREIKKKKSEKKSKSKDRDTKKEKKFRLSRAPLKVYMQYLRPSDVENSIPKICLHFYYAFSRMIILIRILKDDNLIVRRSQERKFPNKKYANSIITWVCCVHWCFVCCTQCAAYCHEKWDMHKYNFIKNNEPYRNDFHLIAHQVNDAEWMRMKTNRQ